MTKNFEDMTQEQKDACVLTYINAENEMRFRAGGICTPRFNSLEDMKKYYAILEEVFRPATSNFKEFQKSSIPDIVFNIESKYKDKE